MTEIGILGAGSWGTALAIHAAGCSDDHTVHLWARREDFAQELKQQRRNEVYLPGVELPASIHPTHRLQDLARCKAILLVVPSHGVRQVVRELLAELPADTTPALVSATKGLEPESTLRMSRVCAEEAAEAGRELRFAVLGGPTFAAELARGVPSAGVIASEDAELARALQEMLSSRSFRLYRTDDVIGVELAGTTKNVIAIAAGVLTGLGLGANTQAALITRGLHEITRLGVKCGGDAATFYGLAGLGDLVLTCTGGLSRNRQVGLQLAEGKTLQEITGGTRMVAEGVRNALAVSQLARELRVEMPITEQMVAVLYHGKAPRDTISELMTRELKAEAAL